MTDSPRTVCSTFLSLYKQAETEVSFLSARVPEFIRTLRDGGYVSSNEFDSLRKENEELKSKIEFEEQWLKKAALDIIDSEEFSLEAMINAVWILSSNSQNCLTILSDENAMNSLVDVFVIEISSKIGEGVIGIFANLCQTEDSCEQFMRYYSEQFTNIVLAVKQNIEHEIVPTKAFELCLAFLINSSKYIPMGEIHAKNFVPHCLLNKAIEFTFSTTIFDGVVKYLNTLITIDPNGIHSYLSTDLAITISEFVSQSSYTPESIELITKIKTLFPAIEILNKQ